MRKYPDTAKLVALALEARRRDAAEDELRFIDVVIWCTLCAAFGAALGLG